MHNDTKKLSARLKRIEGQVRGLHNMLQKGEYCIDVITQSQAVKAALSAFESAMLKSHLEKHAIHQMRHGESGRAVNELMRVYDVSFNKR